MLNPGSAGTKRLLDARINYRRQWIGFQDAPRTSTIAVNSRLYKGKMGGGLYAMQDESGPNKQLNIGLCYAYHIKFPDCELSLGLSGNETRYTLNGTKITLHDSQDPSINQTLSNTTHAEDVGAGLYLYNDRFHLGLSGLHALQYKTEFYQDDTLKKGIIQYATHFYFSVGYNYSLNPDYIWQNTVFANYAPGAPLMAEYTLLLNYKERVFGGMSIRLGDAVAFQIGASFLNDFQVSYSYDFLISKLRSTNSGSHELTVVYSTNLFKSRHGNNVDDRFLRQRYGYLF